MRVRVRLFATLREIVGREDVAWSLRAGATLGDLVADVVQEHPGLAPHRSSMLLAVNWEFTDSSRSLRDGDEVALMPPVSGGRR